MSYRDIYIQRLEAARAEIREIIKFVQGNPTIYEPWHMKEVLDHITGWDDAVIASIKSLLAGEVPATPAARGINVYNEETVSSREAIPYEVTQLEWETSRVELLDLIRQMTEEQLQTHFVLPWGTQGTIETLVEIFTEHEETHAKEIKEIIERIRAASIANSPSLKDSENFLFYSNLTSNSWPSSILNLPSCKYHIHMPNKQAEHNDLMQNRASLTRFAWLSMGAALATITLKTGAYFLTGSVGLLSDAIESLVNLAGASMALIMLTIAARPADESHVYGHSKAEYFASITEGLLILGAAVGIMSAAINRLLHPRSLEQLGFGLAVSIGASAINFVVAGKLMSEGKKRNSITLEADAHHLITDVWTSAGVIGGVAIAGFTGRNALDPLVAIVVALNIIWTGIQLVRHSVAGLMDAALPEGEQKLIQGVMAKYHERGVSFHALRTRQAAARRFISVHILVPGDWTVHDAHHVAEDFESDIRAVLGGVVTVFTHLEPVEDELSMEDMFLDREQ